MFPWNFVQEYRQIMRSSKGLRLSFTRDATRDGERGVQVQFQPGCFSASHFHTVCRRPVWKFDAAGTPSAYQYWVRTNTDCRMHYPSPMDKRGYKETRTVEARLCLARDLLRINTIKVCPFAGEFERSRIFSRWNEEKVDGRRRICRKSKTIRKGTKAKFYF